MTKYLYRINLIFCLVLLCLKNIQAQDSTRFQIKKSGGKVGIYNTIHKKFIIYPTYDEIRFDFKKNSNEYRFVCRNDSQNYIFIFIDSSGKINSMFNFAEWINVKDNSDYVVVDSLKNKYSIYDYNSRKILFDFEYDSIILVDDCIPNYKPHHLSEQNYVFLIKDDQSKLYNLHLKKVVDSLSVVKTDKKNCGYIALNLDPKKYKFEEYLFITKKFKIPYLTEKYYTKIYKDNKVGLIDEYGNFIIECKYDDIQNPKAWWRQYILYKDGKVGYASRETLPDKMKILEPEKNYFQDVFIFPNWVHIVKLNNKYRLIRDSIFFNKEEYDSIIFEGPLKRDKNKNQVFFTQKNKWGILRNDYSNNMSHQSKFIWDKIHIINERELKFGEFDFNDLFYVATKNDKKTVVTSLGHVTERPQKWFYISCFFSDQIMVDEKAITIFGKKFVIRKKKTYNHIYTFSHTPFGGKEDITKYYNRWKNKLVRSISSIDKKGFKYKINHIYFFYRIKRIFIKKLEEDNIWIP